MNSLSALILIHLLLLGNFASGIISGEDVVANTFSHQSAVGVLSRGGICTGTLISLNKVVTAAHCIPEKNEPVSIVFSTSMTSGKVHALPATKIAIHPLWATRSKMQKDTGDIAIIKFAGNPPPGSIPMPFLSIDVDLNFHKIYLIGYGINSPKDRSGSGTLRNTEAHILSTDYSISEGILEQRNTGTCFGDSGGPAIVNYGGKFYLWGVTSRVSSKDCSGYGIYTKTAFYSKWITDQLNRL